MKEAGKRTIQWVKAHWKGLLITGASVATLLLIIKHILETEDQADSPVTETDDFLPNNLPDFDLPDVSDDPEDLSDNIPVIDLADHDEASEGDPLTAPVFEVICSSEVESSEKPPFEVSPHIRNLPAGWHASSAKREEAEENGFELNESQTWVSRYTKRSEAA